MMLFTINLGLPTIMYLGKSTGSTTECHRAPPPATAGTSNDIKAHHLREEMAMVVKPNFMYAFSRGVLRTARVLHHDLKKVASNF